MYYAPDTQRNGIDLPFWDFLGGVLMMFRPYLHYISLFYGIAVLSSQGILMAWKFLKVLKMEQERCCEVILLQKQIVIGFMH